MRYMLLIYGAEDAWTDAERQACYCESAALANDLAATGQLLGTAPLHAAATATCVRVREKNTLITDGPFAEAREQLGGYFLVEAANLDEALAIAARLPSARKGTVEVRPVVEIPNLPNFSTEAVDLETARSTY